MKDTSNSNNIYLIPGEDATYSACIAQTPPTADAIFLAEEQEYPVKMFYQRHDFNMWSDFQYDHSEDREDLLLGLNYMGRCRNIIMRLWDFQV